MIRPDPTPENSLPAVMGFFMVVVIVAICVYAACTLGIVHKGKQQPVKPEDIHVNGFPR